MFVNQIFSWFYSRCHFHSYPLASFVGSDYVRLDFFLHRNVSIHYVIRYIVITMQSYLHLVHHYFANVTNVKHSPVLRVV